MKTLAILRALFVAGCLIAGSGGVRAAGTSFDDELAAVQRDWATALTIDLAKTLASPLTCDISFSKGEPKGPQVAFCDELNPS